MMFQHHQTSLKSDLRINKLAVEAAANYFTVTKIKVTSSFIFLFPKFPKFSDPFFLFINLSKLHKISKLSTLDFILSRDIIIYIYIFLFVTFIEYFVSRHFSFFFLRLNKIVSKKKKKKPTLFFFFFFEV